MVVTTLLLVPPLPPKIEDLLSSAYDFTLRFLFRLKKLSGSKYHTPTEPAIFKTEKICQEVLLISITLEMHMHGNDKLAIIILSNFGW